MLDIKGVQNPRTNASGKLKKGKKRGLLPQFQNRKFYALIVRKRAAESRRKQGRSYLF